MKVKYEFDIHIYSDLEKNISSAVDLHNTAYVLKISKFFKKNTRWYFTVEGDFPKELHPEKIDVFKMDTIFRMGYLVAREE